MGQDSGYEVFKRHYKAIVNRAKFSKVSGRRIRVVYKIAMKDYPTSHPAYGSPLDVELRASNGEKIFEGAADLELISARGYFLCDIQKRVEGRLKNFYEVSLLYGYIPTTRTTSGAETAQTFSKHTFEPVMRPGVEDPSGYLKINIDNQGEAYDAAMSTLTIGVGTNVGLFHVGDIVKVAGTGTGTYYNITFPESTVLEVNSSAKTIKITISDGVYQGGQYGTTPVAALWFYLTHSTNRDWDGVLTLTREVSKRASSMRYRDVLVSLSRRPVPRQFA